MKYRRLTAFMAGRVCEAFANGGGSASSRSTGSSVFAVERPRRPFGGGSFGELDASPEARSVSEVRAEPRTVVVNAPVASWPDGLSLTRVAEHKGQMWLWLRWKGFTLEIRVGKRTGTISKAVKPKHLPTWENDKP